MDLLTAPSSARAVAPERAFDLALGASAATWAVLRLASASPLDRFAPVTLSIAALNLCVAALFVARARAVRGATPRGIAASLPSVMVAAVALRLAPGPTAWSLGAEAALVAGAAFTVASLASLGRSFAVFPALRAVVTRGPYRVVRHPAYCGELAMVGACCAARGDGIALLVGAVACAAVVARVVAEERVLTHDASYAVYAKRVRWRLVPGIW